MSKAARKKKWYAKYFGGYCAIALIPVLLLGLVLGASAVQNSRSDALQRYQLTLGQVANHLDAIVRDMQEMTQSFENNATAAAAMADDAQSKRAQYLPFFLSVCESNSKVPLRAIFYYIGDSFLYTSDGVVSYESLEKGLADQADLDRSAFFTALVKASGMRFLPLYRQTENEETESTDLSVFIVPYPMHALRQSGTFVFFIDLSDLKQVVDNYMVTELDYLYLYDGGYRLIGLSEKARQDEQTRQAFLHIPLNTPATQTLGDEDYVVLRCKTDVFGLQLITGVSARALYAPQSRSLLRILALYLVITLAAVVLAVLLARYSYRPIQRLMKTIDYDGNTDEFHALDQHLDAMNTSLELLEERAMAQQPLAHERLMLGLLRGENGDGAQQTLRLLYPDFCGPDKQYFVLAVNLNEIMPATALPERMELPHASLYGVRLEDEGVAALVAVMPGGADNRQSVMLEFRRRLEELKLHISGVGGGGLSACPDQLPTSFLEAYVALRNHHAGAAEGIFLYAGAALSEKQTAHEKKNRADLLALYLQSLRSVDERTALSLMDALADAIEHENASFLIRRFLYVEAFSRALEAVPPSVAEAFRAETASLAQFSTPDQYRRLMTQLTRQACQAQDESRRSKQLNSRKNILELMQAHYAESSFSLAALSDMAGFSTTYINRCLREESGMSFIQLLSMKRMELAKQLLRTTDTMVKDIVPMVGYLDTASFVRKFKEAEGVTPTEYREMHHS